MTTTISEAWWTRRDAALYAHVSEATIGREVRAGRLRSVRVGGRRTLRFRRDWIDEWLSASLPVEEPVFTSSADAEISNLAARYRDANRRSHLPLT